jgi:hypothetical protein
MKQARASYPQDGNNLWITTHPRRSNGLCPVRRAGPLHPERRLPAQKAPWTLRIVFPVAGEDERRSFKLNGLRKRDGRPGWARKGRESVRRRWILQPAYPRARDRGCPSDADWGISQSSTRPSRVDVIPGCLCGESRSGPDPWKLGRRDDRKVKVTSLLTVSREAQTSEDTPRQPGSTVIRGCACGSNWSHTRRSGPRKRVAFDEAASGDGPGTSSLGGESNPVNPIAGSATEGVRGRVTTLLI